ncbi:hypothetical protein [Glycomyces tenuis]|uniref:hypothetical protein n=1 Tax=Glycomyces tenuis TaxID=58116 RepID=UPI0004056674|nr:hypothetical protein [Glycomyces tenuis]
MPRPAASTPRNRTRSSGLRACRSTAATPGPRRVDDALVTGLYYVRNPEKLAHLGAETVLTLR